jgi:hypothetical protein
MDPSHLPLPFPLRGIDVSTEYELQPELTAPEASNVRGVEPATARERGGSRPGLSRWIDARVNATEAMIQCLDVVATADADALLVAPGQGGGDGGDDWIPDPSTNNEIVNGEDDINDPDYDPDEPGMRNPGPRFVPPEGSGVQPDPHTPSGRDEGEGSEHGWVFVQKKTGKFAFGGASRTDQVTFDSATLRHQMLVVVVYTVGDQDGANDYDPTISVSDSLGNTYSPTDESPFRYNPDGAGAGADILGVYWTRNETGGACTVSVSQTGTAPSPVVFGASIAIIEYRGLEVTTPEDNDAASGFVIANDGSNPTGTLSTGAVPITGSTRLVLGCFTFSHVTASAVLTTPSGYTLRQSHQEGTPDFGLAVYEKLSSAASEDVQVPYDNSSLPFNGCRVIQFGAGWRYA